jgi:hypothetical protein
MAELECKPSALLDLAAKEQAESGRMELTAKPSAVTLEVLRDPEPVVKEAASTIRDQPVPTSDLMSRSPPMKLAEADTVQQDGKDSIILVSLSSMPAVPTRTDAVSKSPHISSMSKASVAPLSMKLDGRVMNDNVSGATSLVASPLHQPHEKANKQRKRCCLLQ